MIYRVRDSHLCWNTAYCDGATNYLIVSKVTRKSSHVIEVTCLEAISGRCAFSTRPLTWPIRFKELRYSSRQSVRNYSSPVSQNEQSSIPASAEIRMEKILLEQKTLQKKNEHQILFSYWVIGLSELFPNPQLAERKRQQRIHIALRSAIPAFVSMLSRISQILGPAGLCRNPVAPSCDHKVLMNSTTSPSIFQSHFKPKTTPTIN